jgi:subtilisin family serine protease
MRRLYYIMLVLGAGLYCGFPCADGADDKISFVTPQASGVSNSSERILVKFKADEVKKIGRPDDKDFLHVLADRLDLPAGAALEDSAFSKWLKNDLKKKGHKDPGTDLSRYMFLNLPPGMTRKQGIERLKKHPLVQWVEEECVGYGGATYPNDQHYNEGEGQWHLKGPSGSSGRIFAPEAWDITTGSASIVVAVLDTGCATNNDDLKGKIVPGYDFVNNDAFPDDDNGHGTRVASILCETGNNGQFGAGVDWNCRLMPVKILNYNNQGTNTWCADGIRWAVTNHARVISMSAGGWPSTNAILDEITNAIANGVVFVTITHNSTAYGSMPFPGTVSDVITVGASDSNGLFCSFSLYGNTVDLLAPGTNMYALGTNNDNAVGWWGTSYSAPQVAGVAALILSMRPRLNNQQVADLLCAGAENRNSPTNGWDQFYGWGVLNAYNSLLLAQTEFGGIIESNDGTFSLEWSSAPNASNRFPFHVEYASSVTGTWTAVSNISYGATNAVWTDTDSTNASTRFYRVNVRQF